VCSDFLTILLKWKLEHVYLLPDGKQKKKDSTRDSSQVDNAKTEIMMVVGQIK
jgi:hypothetical protein